MGWLMFATGMVAGGALVVAFAFWVLGGLS